MLSDEEKAIEELKNKEADYFMISNLTGKTLVNLIEKQQKEIEELKEKCKEVVCIPEGTCFMLEPKDVDKKWEDKIKAKIEDLKENSNGDDFNLINVIMLFKSLLEKE